MLVVLLNSRAMFLKYCSAISTNLFKCCAFMTYLHYFQIILKYAMNGVDELSSTIVTKVSWYMAGLEIKLLFF